jgi:hypothetical protein
MKQLTMGQILAVVNEYKKAGMTQKEINELPIYIGDDDELNGIHTAWYAEIIDPNDDDHKFFVELIEEDYGNVEITGKAFLIS